MEEDKNVLDLLQEIRDIASGKIEKAGNPGNDRIVELADEAAILIAGKIRCPGQPSPLKG